MFTNAMKAFMAMGSALFLVTSCIGDPRPPRPPSTAECLTGLPVRVAQTCGCEPFTRTIEVKIKATTVNELVQKKLVQCVNGALDLKVYTWDIAKGNVEGCIRKEAELDDGIKKTLMKIVESPDEASKDTIGDWKSCYLRETSAPGSAHDGGP